MKKGLFLAVLVGVAAAFIVSTQAVSQTEQGSAGKPQVVSSTKVSATAANPQPSAAAQPAPLTEEEALLAQGKQALEAGQAAAAQNIFLDLISRFPHSPSGGLAAVEMALLYKRAGDVFDERNMLSTALLGLPEGDTRAQVISELHRVNGELIFSRKPSPDSIEYVVKSGDSLFRIGSRYKITAEFIKRINYLSSDRINVGDRFKVFQGPFEVVIEKAKFRATVYLNGICVKEYRIGIGKNDSTPEGAFYVKTKLIDPAWDPPGPEYAASKAPDNPLGTRWIAFDGEYGIHGTIEPESIGKAESRGCVRLLNEEVEELYNLLVIGSKVTVKL